MELAGSEGETVARVERGRPPTMDSNTPTTGVWIRALLQALSHRAGTFHCVASSGILSSAWKLARSNNNKSQKKIRLFFTSTALKNTQNVFQHVRIFDLNRTNFYFNILEFIRILIIFKAVPFNMIEWIMSLGRDERGCITILTRKHLIAP